MGTLQVCGWCAQGVEVCGRHRPCARDRHRGWARSAGCGRNATGLRVPPYFVSSDAIVAIATIASEEAEEAMSCATCTWSGCYVMYLDGRACLLANSVLCYDNVLHYEVAEDAMKTDEFSKVADMAELADRTIRLMRPSFSFSFRHFCVLIFTSKKYGGTLSAFRRLWS